MNQIDIIFPALSGATLIIIYMVIILKRQQKMADFSSETKSFHPSYLYEEHEETWWWLGMSVALINYLVYAFIAARESDELALERIMLGVFIWLFLYLIGKKLTPGRNKG